jgi:hypothetical protein
VGFIYMVLQTIISFKSSSIENDIPGNTLYIRKLRVALCLVDICLLLLRILYSVIIHTTVLNIIKLETCLKSQASDWLKWRQISISASPMLEISDWSPTSCLWSWF